MNQNQSSTARNREMASRSISTFPSSSNSMTKFPSLLVRIPLFLLGPGDIFENDTPEDNLRKPGTGAESIHKLSLLMSWKRQIMSQSHLVNCAHRPFELASAPLSFIGGSPNDVHYQALPGVMSTQASGKILGQRKIPILRHIQTHTLEHWQKKQLGRLFKINSEL